MFKTRYQYIKKWFICCQQILFFFTSVCSYYFRDIVGDCRSLKDIVEFSERSFFRVIQNFKMFLVYEHLLHSFHGCLHEQELFRIFKNSNDTGNQNKPVY